LPLLPAAARAAQMRKCRSGNDRGAHTVQRYLFGPVCLEYSSRRKRPELGAGAQIPEADLSVMGANTGFPRTGDFHNVCDARIRHAAFSLKHPFAMQIGSETIRASVARPLIQSDGRAVPDMPETLRYFSQRSAGPGRGRRLQQTGHRPTCH
jgi:hypothetical protein